MPYRHTLAEVAAPERSRWLRPDRECPPNRCCPLLSPGFMPRREPRRLDLPSDEDLILVHGDESPTRLGNQLLFPGRDPVGAFPKLLLGVVQRDRYHPPRLGVAKPVAGAVSAESTRPFGGGVEQLPGLVELAGRDLDHGHPCKHADLLWQPTPTAYPRRRPSKRPVLAHKATGKTAGRAPANRRSTGASTAAATIRPGVSRRSALACAMRWAWTCWGPSCWRWSTKPCNRPRRRRCGFDNRRRHDDRHGGAFM